MSPGDIPAVFALPHLDAEFFDNLTDQERVLVPFMFRELWLRPDQIIPDYDWRYHGYICGRGWGKSLAIACEINKRVEEGRARALALMAPNAARTEEVQIRFLIETAPPWFKPERYNGGLLWPNGVKATAFTPEAPGRSRSENLDLTWLCEIVDWLSTTRMDAFQNITTATRIGTAQVIWDTTSKGKNEVIQHLEALNKEDPRAYPIRRGTTFNNPLLTPKYLKSVCGQYSGRRYDEEILGMVYSESAGALWEQAWLDDHRVHIPPTNPELKIVGVDPALSSRQDADKTGIVVASRGQDQEVYLEDDLTDHLKPEQWGDVVVDQCRLNGAAGVVIETNHLGSNASFVLKSRAANHGIKIRVLTKTEPFPSRTPGVMYVREVVAASSKTTRAGGPAAETEAGRVHCVGRLPDLEYQFTTYEPGTRKSPNSYDAAVYTIIELASLDKAEPKDTRGDAATAAKVYTALQDRLRRMPTRSVGM